MVLIETWMPPRRRPERRPSSPNVTRSRAASSATMVATIADCSATSRGDLHSTAPGGALPFVRFQTRTVNPAATRLAAMGRPMRPSPMNPTASTSLAQERLDPRLQRGPDQRSVDPAAQPVGLRAVGVEPEGREVEPLQVHVTHFAQAAKPVVAVHAAYAARLHAAQRRFRRRVRADRFVVHNPAGLQMAGDG